MKGRRRRHLESAQRAVAAERAAETGRCVAGVVDVIVAIGHYSNPRAKPCWPSIATLARRMGCHSSTARRRMQRAVAIDVLEVEHRRDPARPDRHLSNLYTFPDPDVVTATTPIPALERPDEWDPVWDVDADGNIVRLERGPPAALAPPTAEAPGPT